MKRGDVNALKIGMDRFVKIVLTISLVKVVVNVQIVESMEFVMRQLQGMVFVFATKIGKGQCVKFVQKVTTDLIVFLVQIVENREIEVSV